MDSLITECFIASWLFGVPIGMLFVGRIQQRQRRMLAEVPLSERAVALFAWNNGIRSLTADASTDAQWKLWKRRRRHAIMALPVVKRKL